MSVQFLADINISPSTVDKLKILGIRIDRVTKFLPATASDEEIIQLAKRKNAVVITQDLDFSSLIAHSREKKPSVISLRLKNAKPFKITHILKNIIPQIEEYLINGAIVSVEDAQIRVRKLPIK